MGGRVRQTLPQSPGCQRQPALIQQNRQPGGGHADAVAAGEDDGADAVHRRLEQQQAGIAAEAVLEAAQQRHRPDTEQQTGGDEAFAEPAAALHPAL